MLKKSRIAYPKRTNRLSHEPLEPRCMLAGLAVPALSSNPTASMKLFLDFDGHSGGWGSPFSGLFERDATTPPYSVDTDMTCFSESELQDIREIHQIVSEKFSIFDVDVTTIDPGELHDGVAGKVVIGGNGDWAGGGGGVAQHGGFYNWLENIGFIWDSPGNTRYIGEGAAHEFGHMLGLHHQSRADFDGNITTEYRPRMIMGRGDLGGPGGRWNIGTSSGVDSFDGSVDNNGLQNDIGKLISDGLSLRPDDHSNFRTSATLMPVTSSGFAMSGVITPGMNPTTPDIDWFQFDPVLLGASFSVSVKVDSLAPMLNPQIELYDISGSLVATANTAEYGETIEIASATSPTYYVVVKPGPGSGQEFNVGSYNLVMERNDATDDTSASATSIVGVDDRGGGPFTYGRHVAVDFVGSSDQIDWFRFRTPTMSAGRSVFVSAGNLSGNVDLRLLRDVTGDGSVDLSTSDVIRSSTNPGTLTESISTTEVLEENDYYIAVEHIDGPNTGYELNLQIDRSEPGQPYVMPSTHYELHYDFVGLGDDDSFSVPADWSSGIITRSVSLQFHPYDQTAEIVMGYDTNENNRLDDSEVTFSDTVPGGMFRNYDNIRGRNLNDDLLLVDVREFGTNRTNYLLQWVVDEMPILDSDFLQSASHQLGDLTSSRHGGFLEGLILTENDVDVINLGQPSGGFMEVQVTPPQSGGAKFEFIADWNNNGIAEPNEVLSEDDQFFLQTNPGDPTQYYLIANFDPGFAEFAEYEVLYRDGLVMDPSGNSADDPRPIGGDEFGSTIGYVARSNRTELHRPEVVYQIEAEEPSTLTLNLISERSNEPPQAGIQFYQDWNGNDILDPDERSAGFAGRNLTHQVDLHVTAGTYFIVVSTPEFELSSSDEALVDFELAYAFSSVVDDEPVEVFGASVETTDTVTGILVEFSEDVGMTLGTGDVLLRDSLGNEVELEGQLYDPQQRLLFLGLDNVSPGDFELQVRKDSVADSYGNRLADDFFFAFTLEEATGDFDGDGDYDCADINALTGAVANGSNNAKFDLNGDGQITLDDVLSPQSGWLAEAGANSQATGGNAFLVGDANLDGNVDISDFNLWNANKFTNSTEWCRANFDGDQVVDISDFNHWNANKFSASAGLAPLESTLPARIAAMDTARIDLMFAKAQPSNQPHEFSCVTGKLPSPTSYWSTRRTREFQQFGNAAPSDLIFANADWESVTEHRR